MLLVLAHPALERSRANQALLSAAVGAARRRADTTSTRAYPDFLVDVPKEQKRLIAHDIIALQFPLYWYSTPSLLKEWIDAVWLHGFAYGRAGLPGGQDPVRRLHRRQSRDGLSRRGRPLLSACGVPAAA